MMQEWADYLGELQAGAKVIPDSRSRVVSAWQDRWNEKWPVSTPKYYVFLRLSKLFAESNPPISR